ncbi:MAG: hypothetical protein ACFFER_09905 [Candidatus Thorarchaeota archaeon]
MKERVEGNISVSIDTSWFGRLFFTSNRVIVVCTEQKRFSPEESSYVTRMILRRVHGHEIDEDQRREQMYMTAHPDDILADDTKNFAIPYSNITRIELKKPGRILTGSITIAAANREKPYKYRLRESSVLFDEYESLLRSLMPDKLFIS